MGAVLALIAAVSYGVGDFVGGVGGRRSVPGLIPLAIQVVGVLFAAAAVGFGVGTAPTTTVLVWGAVSGIGSGIGGAALFRGLSGGQMSVVAPLSAVVTAALPALVGLASGDRLAWWGCVGIAVALPAVALTSWPGGTDGFRLADALYGTVAGCGFGLLFIALDQAGTSAGAWPLLPGQVVALLVVSTVAVPEIVRLVRAHQPIRLSTAARWGLAAGVFGATANLMFLLATGVGQLTVAAVLADLYPAITVALIVLHERIQRLQATGLIAAAAAVVLIVTAS
jgi:drug/metabolite transporter (DMT)-like permease